MAFRSGCRLEDLAVPSPSLRRCFINNNTIRSLFYLFCFFVYLVASINKLELNSITDANAWRMFEEIAHEIQPVKHET